MSIELQDEFVTDEIHIHFRDFRFAMNRDCFKTFAQCVNEASMDLDRYLQEITYERKFHADRVVDDFNSKNM